MSQFFKVHPVDADYEFDIISADSADDAARRYIAQLKWDQVEDIERGKREYARLKADGRITDSWEGSGFPVNVVLPEVVAVTPIREPIHFQSIDSRTELRLGLPYFWDLSKRVEVRL